MLNWYITCTDANGDTHTTTATARTATDARNIGIAWAAALATADTTDTTTAHTTTDTTDATDTTTDTTTADTLDTLRVYPSIDTADGIARGAVLVTYRTALNGIMRTGGNVTQWTIYKDARRLTAVSSTTPTAAAIFAALSECGADVQDYVSTAYGALIDGAATAADVPEIYHGAYRALNEYIRGLRAATAHELSTEYIVDGGGDICEYVGAIASVIRGGDTWTAAADDLGRLTAEKAATLGRTLTAALAKCTAIQKKIVKLLALDVSVREIARRLHRDDKTIRRHIANIRGKVKDEIKANAPQFAYLLRAALIDRQTAAKKAEEKKNRHTAEYYRAYRALKKAAAVEKAAAEKAAAETAAATAETLQAMNKAAADMPTHTADVLQMDGEIHTAAMRAYYAAMATE